MMHPYGSRMLCLCLALAGASGLTAEQGFHDPVFSTIPFDSWLGQNNAARIRSTVHLSDPALTPHQRLAVSVDVEVDGAEISRRAGQGKILLLLQVSDERNRTWQSHQEFDLENLREGIKAHATRFTQSFFVIPGEYRVAVGVLDSARGDYSITQRDLRVAELRNDPLPEMWRGLPAIEFFSKETPADRWYLPSIDARPNLMAEAHHPVMVDLLVNLTPAERLQGSTRVRDRNLEALLPEVKVLTEVDWRNVTLNVEFLDLSRRRVAFRQNDVRTLEWWKIGDALDDANPGIIDVKSLENRRYTADFFLGRVTRHLRGPRIVIVLSAAVSFDPGMDIHPIETAHRPDVRLIYVRYQPGPRIVVAPDGVARRNFVLGGIDQLEPMLKPLSPRLFEVSSPDQFRKSLAAILAEISKF